MIDDLGDIRARIAALETREKDLKALLADLEPGAYEGERFRLTITLADRDQLDMAAVREKLTPQFLRAHTTTKSVRTLRTAARRLPVDPAVDGQAEAEETAGG
jgi:hypothetical protein